MTHSLSHILGHSNFSYSNFTFIPRLFLNFYNQNTFRVTIHYSSERKRQTYTHSTPSQVSRHISFIRINFRLEFYLSLPKIPLFIYKSMISISSMSMSCHRFRFVCCYCCCTMYYEGDNFTFFYNIIHGVSSCLHFVLFYFILRFRSVSIPFFIAFIPTDICDVLCHIIRKRSLKVLIERREDDVEEKGRKRHC